MCAAHGCLAAWQLGPGALRKRLHKGTGGHGGATAWSDWQTGPLAAGSWLHPAVFLSPSGSQQRGRRHLIVRNRNWGAALGCTGLAGWQDGRMAGLQGAWKLSPDSPGRPGRQLRSLGAAQASSPDKSSRAGAPVSTAGTALELSAASASLPHAMSDIQAARDLLLYPWRDQVWNTHSTPLSSAVIMQSKPARERDSQSDSELYPGT